MTFLHIDGIKIDWNCTENTRTLMVQTAIQLILKYWTEYTILEKLKKANIKGHSIIAKNSVFNNLRSLLSKDFEWIITDQRLHLESVIQKNCVENYKNKIIADECTIYSYVFPDTHERHTIEFGKNKNQYKVIRIQRYCNRGYDQRIKEYLNRLIENCCK